MFPESTSQYFRILSVLELRWGPKREYAHARNFHALSFRIEGDAAFEHNGESFHASTGQIAFVPKGFDYMLNVRANEHLYVVHFDILPDVPAEFVTFSLFNAAYYEELLRKMHQLWQQKQTGYQYAATSLFFSILEQLVKENAQRTKKSGKDKLTHVLEYIHRHYTDAVMSVASLSELYGASPTYFRRVFNQTYGVSPLQYIHTLRLKRAEELLLSGYYSVAEAAYATGYTDPKYFSRLFKQHKGIAPSTVGGKSKNEQK